MATMKTKTFVGSYRHRDRWLTFDIAATGFADAAAQRKAFTWARVVEVDGKPARFEVRYPYLGGERTFAIEAADLAEAKDHLNALCMAGRIDGELIARGPIAALPLALLALRIKRLVAQALLILEK